MTAFITPLLLSYACLYCVEIAEKFGTGHDADKLVRDEYRSKSLPLTGQIFLYLDDRRFRCQPDKFSMHIIGYWGVIQLVVESFFNDPARNDPDHLLPFHNRHGIDIITVQQSTSLCNGTVSINCLHRR